MSRFFISLLMLVALAACASGSYIAPVAPEKKAGIKTIGFASVIGDKMVYTGSGYFGSETGYESYDISAWNIDAYMQDEVRKRLGSQYKIVPIKVNAEAFRYSALPPDQAIHAAVLPGQTPVDAYLFLIPTMSSDYIGHTSTMMKGLGIYRRISYGIQVYAACDLLLMDTKSPTLLGGGQLGFNSNHVSAMDFASGNVLSKALQGGELSHRKIPASFGKAKKWSDFTPAQLDQLKAEIQSLLHDSIDFPLIGAGLAQ